MCYTANVSLIAFVVNVVTCSFLYRYNQVLALFFWFVGLMQVYDFIFWLNPVKNSTNAFFTKLACITNHLQPIFLAWLIQQKKSKPLKPLSISTVTLYTLVIAFYTLIHWNQIDYTLVTPQSQPSLFWKWNNMPGNGIAYGMFLTTLTLISWAELEHPVNAVASVINVVSFFLSMYYYKGQTSVGRFWCYFATYVPLIFVILYSLHRQLDVWQEPLVDTKTDILRTA